MRWLSYRPDGTVTEFSAPPGPPHWTDADGQAWTGGPGGPVPFDRQGWLAGDQEREP